jgi:transcriptional regulator with PAS, ATPase and Fis domain
LHFSEEAADIGYVDDIRSAKRASERRHIEDALRKNNFQVSRTAKDLGIHRATLYRKMKELSIVIDTEM